MTCPSCGFGFHWASKSIRLVLSMICSCTFARASVPLSIDEEIRYVLASTSIQRCFPRIPSVSISSLPPSPPSLPCRNGWCRRWGRSSQKWRTIFRSRSSWTSCSGVRPTRERSRSTLPWRGSRRTASRTKEVGAS